MTRFARIRFEHRGKIYEIGLGAYDGKTPVIVLPDRTVLKVTGWSNALTPVPSVVVTPNLFSAALEPEPLAAILGGVVAREIEHPRP